MRDTVTQASNEAKNWALVKLIFELSKPMIPHYPESNSMPVDEFLIHWLTSKFYKLFNEWRLPYHHKV